MDKELADISTDFLKSELDKTIQFSRKGGPYTKLERIKRRGEVIRLHFEEGIPGTKIAEMIRVHRHTVSEDIKFGYKELSEQWDEETLKLILKQMYRFEIQRARLFKKLTEQNRFHEWIMLEKIILEIDSKIAQMVMKARITEEQELIIIDSKLNHTQARFASLDKNIIEPLKNEWGFIEIEKIGRNRWIKITEEGRNAAEFLI